MRSSGLITVAFAATALATPVKRQDVVDTIVDVVYVTDVVTETAGTESVALTTTTVEPTATAWYHWGHHSHSSSETTSAEVSNWKRQLYYYVFNHKVNDGTLLSVRHPSTSAHKATPSFIPQGRAAGGPVTTSTKKASSSTSTKKPTSTKKASSTAHSSSTPPKPVLAQSTTAKSSSSTHAASSSTHAASTSTHAASSSTHAASSSSHAATTSKTSSSSHVTVSSSKTTAKSTQSASTINTAGAGGSTIAFGGPMPTDYVDLTLAHHNVHRTNHSASNIAWSSSMASIAKSIAETCVYAHNVTAGGGGYGQNIAAGVEPQAIGSVITDLMYNGEVNYYTGLYGEANPDMTNFEHWGHFSQIVWQDTTQVGCYTANCTAQGLANTGSDIPPYFTVCNYSPPGNYGGEYTNVGSPLNHPTVYGTYT